MYRRRYIRLCADKRSTFVLERIVKSNLRVRGPEVGLFLPVASKKVATAPEPDKIGEHREEIRATKNEVTGNRSPDSYLKIGSFEAYGE